MIEFLAGVVLGAVFAPFWMKVYSFSAEKVRSFMGTSKE